MAKRFKLKDRKGKVWEWSYGELADTLFEGEGWDTAAVAKRVRALKVGGRMTIKGETLTRLNPSKRKAKREPNPKPKLADLGVLSEHGRVHELVVETAAKPDHDEVFSFKQAGYPLLLWSPRQKALVFAYGVKVPRPRKGAPPRTDGAAATFERFHGRDVESYRDDVPIPAVPLRDLGPAVSLAYRGERWAGKVAEHPFGKNVRAYAGGGPTEGVYVVAGGNLRMTARGIEG